ncbi:hypothetical protein [Georhizobium sp. MAB10]|uniref:hypothetical protein n=1 Tax=Georhizobium sp. MAB10 TaxID=3028319 RepID=UPI003855CE3E
MTKVIALLTATLMSSAAIAAPMVGDHSATDRAEAPIILAQAASNNADAGESPDGPIIEEEDTEVMGTTTGPDEEQADNDGDDGESPSAAVVDEEELIDENASGVTTGPDASQAAEDMDSGATPRGPAAEQPVQ